MKPSAFYKWELEDKFGKIVNQYDVNGVEQSWKQIEPKNVVRMSFVPAIGLLPRHDVFIDIANGIEFIKRFGRGFIKQGADGFKLKHYINCCVTNNFRFWVFSNGNSMITHKDYEAYL